MTNVEEVRQRLAELADANGGKLTPDMVVEDARSSSSPLHNHFIWNDSIAAEEYRKEQARELIRSVRVIVTTETKTISSIAYVRDPRVAGNAQGYIKIEKLISERELAIQSMNEELTRAMNSAQRAASLGESLGFDFEVEPIVAAIKKAQDRLNSEAAA